MKLDVIKLTDKNMRTHGGFQWELNEPAKVSGKGELCGPGFLHWYEHPLLAVLLNPIHGSYDAPRMFRGVAEGVIKYDAGLKGGSSKLTLTEEIPVPVISTAQRVMFAKLCAEFAQQAAKGPRMNHGEILAALIACAETACK